MARRRDTAQTLTGRQNGGNFVEKILKNRKKKRRAHNDTRVYLSKVFALFLALIMVLSVVLAYAGDAMAADASPQGEVEITMLDVGQGLSLLVKSDDEYMLYDGGGRKASRYVVSYLKKHGIEKIKDVVISHFDEDHCAGIVGVLSAFPVSQIYMPDYSTDTKIYSALISKIKDTNTPYCYPYVGDTFYVGTAKVEVLGPAGYDYTDANDDSIILKISCGAFSCLISGDAEKTEETDTVLSGADLKSTLYVAGHHGSSSSSSPAFLSAIAPEYAFLSVGADNKYGHPGKATMAALKNMGTKIFRTDEQGEVSAMYKDGELSFSASPSSDYSYREPGSSEKIEEKGQKSGKESTEKGVYALEESTEKEPEKEGETKEYIINTGSGKFHLPGCRAAKKIGKENRKERESTKEELIAEGYEPCKICMP